MRIGDIIIAHLAAGNAPAIVTRVNSDNTISLTAFPPGGDVIGRDNVPEYVREPDDEPGDEVGYWSRMTDSAAEM